MSAVVNELIQFVGHLALVIIVVLIGSCLRLGWDLVDVYAQWRYRAKKRRAQRKAEKSATR